MISTSEIKISVVVDEKYTELAVRALHTASGSKATAPRHVSPGCSPPRGRSRPVQHLDARLRPGVRFA